MGAPRGQSLAAWALIFFVAALAATCALCPAAVAPLAAAAAASHPRLAAALDAARAFVEPFPRAPPPAAAADADAADAADSCECAAAPAAGADETAACQLAGVVPDCCCAYAAVERVNREELRPLLAELVRAPFFRYFKTDLYCECPLWPEDGMCSLRDCAVCECEPDEVPAPWRAAEGLAEGAAGVGLAAGAAAAPAESCAGAARESEVDRTLPPSVRSRLAAVRGWRGLHNPWMPEDGGACWMFPPSVSAR
jgi:hypothetical protein